MKRIIGLCLSLLLLSVPVWGSVHYQLSDFTESAGNGQFGVVSIDGYSYAKLGFSPDLTAKNFTLAIDLNLYLPFDSDAPYPDELSWFNIRYLAYDYENRHGFKWGHLYGITMGQGLLIDRYDSGSFGSSQFGLNKGGFYGYTTLHTSRIEAMYTASSLAAIRYQVPLPDPVQVMGAPVVLGATYASDSDGVDRTLDDVTITRPEQDGYGIDLSIPIAGDFLTVYSEYSELIDRGKGASTGVRGDVMGIFDYRLQYMRFGAGFVPGYFNSTYEATSFTFATDAPTEETNGFLGAASYSFMRGYLRAGAQLEKYDNQDMLGTASLGWKRIGNTVGVVNYTQPFNGEDHSVLSADFLVSTGGWMDYVFHYKRVNVNSDEYTESWQVETRVKLGEIFSF